jgi:hypothetical protein
MGPGYNSVFPQGCQDWLIPPAPIDKRRQAAKLKKDDR